MIPNKSSPKQNRGNEQIALHSENMNEGSSHKGGLGRCQELVAHTGAGTNIALWSTLKLVVFIM
jgi:hypothetical protein